MITQSETSLFRSERRSCAWRVVLEPPYEAFHSNAPYFCSSAAMGAHFRGMKWSEFRTWHLWKKELQFFKVLWSPIRSDHLFGTRFCLVKVGLEWGWKLKKESKNKQCAFGWWGSFHSKGIDNWFLQIWSTLKVSAGDDMSRIPQECLS